MRISRCKFVAISVCFLMAGFGNRVEAQKKAASLGTLTSGEKLHGFTAKSVYLNDAGQPMGGRFIHDKTGFTLDLLRIESVPQTFIYVNTFPVSDRGEPHTQEHLLITKGNKGHQLNTRLGMSLARDNAFTSQIYTSYNFYTGGGADIFYSLFESYLDALLYPDYSNEEISREVCNWGVAQNPDKTLRLEEKGSVYNEMSTTMNNPYSVLYDTVGRLLYGDAHPLSYNAGGLPSGIRELKAADIHRYHNDLYYLGNIGAIVSLSKTSKLDDVLQRMDGILTRLGSAGSHVSHTRAVLPPPNPATKGQVAIVGYPSENAQQPSPMVVAYPATRKLDATGDLMLANFLNVFAGDATTNLYKIFVNSKTRKKDFDAQDVYAYSDDKEGQPVFIGLDGIRPENLTAQKAEVVKQDIREELKRIASWKDHSPELLEFNKRFENSLTSSGRSFAKFVNSPPKFGFRNTGGQWHDQLKELDKVAGFRKSVILKPQFEEIRKMLSGGTNIWKDYLQQWDLINATPYVVITRADPSLKAKIEADTKVRADREVAYLENLYHITDPQDAIVRYKAVYDSNTAVLEKAEQAHRVSFMEHPPLTLDDQLQYKTSTLPGNIPMVASVFNNMSSATFGIDINLNGVPENQLVYLAMLPELLTGTGIIKDGKAVSYEDMQQMIQGQILSLRSHYNTNGTTGRAELEIKAAGNNQQETKKAIGWIHDVLQAPNWRSENLPRIRDLVDQQWSGMRKIMQGPEESWVRDPADAYLYQDQPLLLATSSFLTTRFNVFRLKWMLTDGGDAATSASIQDFLSSLANAATSRTQLAAVLSAITKAANAHTNASLPGESSIEAYNQLPAQAKALAHNAVTDLQQLLNDIPDTSLATDWPFLCHTIQKDLLQTPQKTLDDLSGLRKSLLRNDRVRMFEIGSAATEEQLTPDIEHLLAEFDPSPTTKQNYSRTRSISERVKSRMHTQTDPVFVGLIHADSPTGVFINSAPLVTYRDTTRTDLLTFLAAELYGGAGKQSVYTKSTGAGLSYSTGVGASPSSGTFGYYAERTPLLPQTLRFVIDEIKKAPVDSNVVDYVVSLAVGGLRSAADYEDRGEAMANDLADGLTPEVVKEFRLAILRLRKEPGLLGQIYAYKDRVYEKILPGYGIPSREVPGGSFFVIGAEKQMVAYEAYLKSVDGEQTRLFRLYPRDFWMVPTDKE